MICEKCLNEFANVHLQQIVNGEKTEMHLCSKCAATLGIIYDDSLSFDDFFQSFVDSFLTQQNEAINLTDEKQLLICQSCGLTYPKFKSTGRFGCASCYDTFSQDLTAILSSIQAGSVHKGKFPSKYGKEIIKEREIDELKKQLSQAVEKEEYEEAVKLRDKIKNLSAGE